MTQDMSTALNTGVRCNGWSKTQTVGFRRAGKPLRKGRSSSFTGPGTGKFLQESFDDPAAVEGCHGKPRWR